MYLQYVQSLLNFGIDFSKSHKSLMPKDTYKLDNHLFNSFYFDNWFFMHHIFQSPPLAISNL